MQMVHSLAKSKQQLSRVLDQEPIWALSSYFKQGKNLEEKHMAVTQAKERQFFAQPFPKQLVNKECKYKSEQFLFCCPISVLLLENCCSQGIISGSTRGL